MRIRYMAASLLGLTLVTSAAVAQDTSRAKPRPEQRIKISKGEVALPPRVDTVYVTRLDTVTLSRFDTVLVPVTRVDTVRYPVWYREEPTPPAPPIPLPKTFYGSIYTGMTMPSGNIDRLYTDGFHAGAAIGWDDDGSPLGLRLSGGLTRLGRENGIAIATVGTTTPLLVSTEFDVKLATPDAQGIRAYGIGGATFHAYRGIATVSKSGSGMGNVDGRGGWYQPVSGSDWSNKFGFNVGGGAELPFAGKDLYLEARAVTLNANGARSWFVPISLGVRFF